MHQRMQMNGTAYGIAFLAFVAFVNIVAFNVLSLVGRSRTAWTALQIHVQGRDRDPGGPLTSQRMRLLTKIPPRASQRPKSQKGAAVVLA